MKKFIAAILAVIMVLSLAACGGPKAPTIELESNTGYDYMEIYISPSSESTWGDDLLQGNVISRGDSAQIQLAPSEDMTYDMRIVDEDGDYWVFRNFVVADGARVIVSGSSMEVIANNRSTTFDGELQTQTPTAAPTPTPTPTTPSAPSAAGTLRINLANQTGDDFTFCYMSSSSDSSWGSDLFTGSTSDIVIFRDQQTGYIDVTGAAGSYDLKLADGSSDFVAWGGLEVHNGSTIIITVSNGQWVAVVDGTPYAAAQAQGTFANSGSAAAPSAPSTNGEVRVNITNASDVEFYYCKCSPSSDSSWGSDLFTGSTSDIVVFDPNESGYIILPSTNGTYDLRLETSSSGNLAAQWFNLPIHNGSTVVISGNSNGLTATVDGQSFTAQIGTRN